MREILFRGKRDDTGEWIEGDLRQDKDIGASYISGYDYYTSGEGLQRDPYEYEVIPESVGQYTGLTDKNGTKIFEGDIVHAVYQSNYISCKNIDFGIGVVKYEGSYYRGAAYGIDIIGESGLRILFTASFEHGTEVIGNIYNNPELLKGE